MISFNIIIVLFACGVFGGPGVSRPSRGAATQGAPTKTTKAPAPRPGSGQAPRPGSAQAASPKTLELYQKHCQVCHGPDGVSLMKPMSFVGREWKHGARLQDSVKVIGEGVKATAMLPFKEKLTKDEILALAKLVRSFDKKS